MRLDEYHSFAMNHIQTNFKKVLNIECIHLHSATSETQILSIIYSDTLSMYSDAFRTFSDTQIHLESIQTYSTTFSDTFSLHLELLVLI